MTRKYLILMVGVVILAICVSALFFLYPTEERKLRKLFVCKPDLHRPEGVNAELPVEDIIRKGCIRELEGNAEQILGFIAEQRMPDRETFRSVLAIEDCLDYLGARLMTWCENRTGPRYEACKLMEEAEAQQLAREIRAEVLSLSEINIDRESELAALAQVVGERVLTARATSSFRGPCRPQAFDFLVYSSDDPRFRTNAIALPDGTILISKDLLKKLKEAELAFVLGHEIAHIDWASFDAKIIYLIAEPNGVMEELERIWHIGTSVCRGPMDELFVDRYGVYYATAAGYDPMAAAALFSSLLNDNEGAETLSWTQSHPPSAARATRAWLAAESYFSAREPIWQSSAYFRGASGFTRVWDHQVPQQVEDFCKEQTAERGIVSVTITIEVDEHKPDGRRWDSTGPPEINGKVTFADDSVIVIPTHQESYTARASGWRSKPNAGEQIHVFLQDLDLSDHDTIASGYIRYEGGETFSGRVGSAVITLQLTESF